METELFVLPGREKSSDLQYPRLEIVSPNLPEPEQVAGGDSIFHGDLSREVQTPSRDTREQGRKEKTNANPLLIHHFSLYFLPTQSIPRLNLRDSQTLHQVLVRHRELRVPVRYCVRGFQPAQGGVLPRAREVYPVRESEDSEQLGSVAIYPILQKEAAN